KNWSPNGCVDRCRTNGNRYQVKLLSIFTFSRDPQLIKEVAITKHKLFPKPPEAYGVLDLFGSNILTSNGEYWEKHRRIVGPHFSVEKHLRKIHEASVTHAKTMLSLWEKEHNLVTVKDYLQHFTLDVIGSAAFGYELHALLNMKLSD